MRHKKSRFGNQGDSEKPLKSIIIDKSDISMVLGLIISKAGIKAQGWKIMVPPSCGPSWHLMDKGNDLGASSKHVLLRVTYS